MAPRRRADSGYVLEVPIDLSTIERDAEGQELKVLALRSDGTSVSEIAEVAPGGTGTVRLRFDEAPGSLRVLVGPARATDEELAAANTLGIDVPGRLFENRETRIAPILIRPYWWYWWLRWCREFVIRGRVVCENGCPVPGAEVCAYDVDWWWWWLSTQQVGCDTTDANGVFEINPIYLAALYAYKDGARKRVTYWCDVCAIRTYSPGPCWCCREETALDLRDPDKVG